MANLQTGLTPGTVFGGYRIEAFLARGGMGVIYQATQLALQRTVALKLVAPELAHDEAFRERFKREAQLAASLDHPNILPIYEAGEINGQLFLAMRYVVGIDMDTLIRRQHVVMPQRAVAIVAQVAGALDAAHGRGLVHRDVKPGNILIAEEYGEERAYLTDFGLTKSVATGAHLTKTGQMVGTLDYVAPEQVQGRPVDGRTDTYALACVLYRTVTGQIPFERPGDLAKMWAHLNDPPPSASALAPAVSPELEAVIRRGMAKRPDERYSSSGEFARAALAAAAPVANGPLEPTEPTEVDATPIDPMLITPPRPLAPEPTTSDRRTVGGWRRGFAGSRAAIYAAGVLAVLAIGAIIAIVSGGGGTSPTTQTPVTPVASTAGTRPPSTASASTPTATSSPAQARAAAYHAQVDRIIPRMHAVFRTFPSGSDFGKAVFSQRSLSVAAGLRGIADNLDSLSPPQAVLVDHEALVTHLREMEQAFRSLAADSDNRDFNGARRDLERTKLALAQINASVRRVLRTPTGP